jgi:GxxExxY protein
VHYGWKVGTTKDAKDTKPNLLQKTSNQGISNMTLILKDESYAIMGACFEVYREKGCGFIEPVYQECLEIEFVLQSIPFAATPKLPLTYKAKKLKKIFRPDFICYGLIVVEIKAVSALNDQHRAQVNNYVKATGLQLGLLVNFGTTPKVDYERIIR